MQWYQKIKPYLVDIKNSVLPEATIVFIISLIVRWDKKEGLMTLGIAIIIALMKSISLSAIKSYYEKLENRIDRVVDDITKKTYILQPTNILVDFKPPLLKKYFHRELISLQKEVNRASEGGALTEYSIGELYEIILFMTDNKETKDIYSLDLSIDRWTGIFSEKDYTEMDYSTEDAAIKIEENKKNKGLNETARLYDINEKRLKNFQDKLTVKRIFGIAKKNDRNPEYLQVLKIINELEKRVVKNRLQTKVLVEEELRTEAKKIYEDMVIFNEEIAFKERTGHESGHLVILKPEDVNKYKKNFDDLWLCEKAIPVATFLSTHLSDQKK